jgi:hypothetical protein
MSLIAIFFITKPATLKITWLIKFHLGKVNKKAGSLSAYRLFAVFNKKLLTQT